MRAITRPIRLLTAQPVGREEAFAYKQRPTPRRVFLASTVVLCASSLRTSGATPPVSAHEERPTQPWIKPPSSAVAGGVAHCGPWEREGYRSIQVNVDARGCNIVGDAANEPSIAVDLTDPRKIVIGWRQFDSVASDFRQAGYAYSHDGGHTWVFPGSLTPGVFGSDPVLAANADGTIYYLSINFDEMRLFRTHDGGLTWPDQIQVAPYFLDKPWMTVDRTNGIGHNNIYICSVGGFARSTDSGETFMESPDGGGSCSGGTVAVGPHGDVYVAVGGGIVYLSTSTSAADPNQLPLFSPETDLLLGNFTYNSGRPNPGGFVGQVWVATNPPEGLSTSELYVLTLAGSDPLRIDPGDVVFCSSPDGGTTWTRPRVINDDPLTPTAWQWFNTLSVAPNGRIDVVWNDTRNSQQPNLSELFYSFSTDRGRTWSPNVPVSPMFDSWIGWPEDNHKIGDYYHMVSDNLGVNVAYAATFNGEQDIYFLRIGPWDCNGNEVADENDISVGTSLDCNANEVPDECEYRADLDGDGLTTLTDHAAFASKMTGPFSPSCLRASMPSYLSEHPLTSVRGSDDPPSSPLCEGGGTPLPDGRGSDCDGTGLLDIDHDGDIDLADFYGLQRVFAGSD